MAKIDDSVKKKVPELRFPGFTDDWEERKFSNLAEVRRGLTYKPSDVQKYGIRVLRSSNIAEDTFLIKSDDVFVNKEAVKIDKVKNGDILITSANGSSRLVGKHALIEGIENDTVHGGFMLVARAEKPEFVNAIMSSSWYSKFINIFVSGGNGAIGNLSKSNLEDQKVYVPSEIEQTKIGLFFKGLDDTIALHQRKLDLLKEQKKGYLQKMFPKNGAKVPELRFAGFADDWEERKFFESIASTIDFRGRTPKKLGMDWSDSGYLALSALNVKNGYIDPLADAHYGDEKLYRKWMSGRELKKGQVLFTTEAPMGNVAQVPDDNGYILSQRTVAFETKEDMMTNDFLAVLLKSPLVFNNLSALSSGGTAKGVSQKSLKGLSITVPLDIDEQKKIGSFFKQLDNSIALHQRKLDLLKEQKKGFLQKMFV